LISEVSEYGGILMGENEESFNYHDVNREMLNVLIPDGSDGSHGDISCQEATFYSNETGRSRLAIVYQLLRAIDMLYDEKNVWYHESLVFGQGSSFRALELTYGLIMLLRDDERPGIPPGFRGLVICCEPISKQATQLDDDTVSIGTQILFWHCVIYSTIVVRIF
jgi:hypothetical protein